MSRSYTDEILEEAIAVDLNQPLDIAIGNQRGEVVVRGADREDVLIRAEKHGNAATVAYQEAAIEITTVNGKIEIRPILPDNSSPGRSVTVDLGLDFGPDFLRDLLDPDRRHSERDQGRRERPERHRERKTRGFSVTWDNNVTYDMAIEVPRRLECRLSVSTASGEISVRDLDGHLDLRTASGEISIQDVNGQLNLTTASGDIELRQVDGEVRYNTASGDFESDQLSGSIDGRTASGDAQIEQSALRGFNFETVSGDLRLDAAITGAGPYQIKTVSGDCQLALAAIDPASGADRAFTVSFESRSGDARLGDGFQSQGAGRWATSADLPGPLVTVNSVSGDLRGSVGASSGATSLARQAGVRTERPATPSPVATTASVPPAPSTPVVVPPAPPVVPPAAAAPPPTPSVASGGVHTGGLPTGKPEPMADADRLALLEAVERGEIDIEEALRQLDDRADE